MKIFRRLFLFAQFHCQRRWNRTKYKWIPHRLLLITPLLTIAGRTGIKLMKISARNKSTTVNDRHCCWQSEQREGMKSLVRLTRLVSWVSIMKLWTCFSARVSSNFRETTATNNAVQPAPFNKSKSILLSLMYGPYGSPCSPVNEMSNIHGNGSLAPVCFSTVAIILAHSSENNSVSSSHVPHEQFHFASLNFVLTFFF